MRPDFDVIVVGAGVEGLWTAKYAAQKGAFVLLLEQFAWPHSRASSFGPTRMTRLAYDRKEYGALMPTAMREWQKLEEETKMELYRETGVVVVGHGENPRMTRLDSALRSNETLHEKISSTNGNSSYKQIRLPVGFRGFFEKTGGLLFASKAILALMNSFLKCGGVFHDSEVVTAVTPINSLEDKIPGVRIRTNKSQYVAHSVVLTMGPWAPQFLQLELRLNLPVKAQKTVWCYWRTLNPRLLSADRGMPSVIAYWPKDNPMTFYFKPSLEYPGLVNFGLHKAWPASPDDRDAIDTTKEYIDLSRKFAATFFPPGSIDLSQPALVESAMYTENVEDGGFILDRHPQHPQIVIGTGFSGHGFKMAPVVGQVLGDMAIENKTNDVNLDIFGIKRLKTRSKL